MCTAAPAGWAAAMFDITARASVTCTGIQVTECPEQVKRGFLDFDSVGDGTGDFSGLLYDAGAGAVPFTPPPLRGLELFATAMGAAGANGGDGSADASVFSFGELELLNESASPVDLNFELFLEYGFETAESMNDVLNDAYLEIFVALLDWDTSAVIDPTWIDIVLTPPDQQTSTTVSRSFSVNLPATGQAGSHQALSIVLLADGHAVAFADVPAPGTIAMVAIGLGMLGFGKRLRKS
ncbi:MAG: PEP-CTERM sorting domain-containing protein [Gammaproteobacteria bacterium]|nr:PEP-CTERM sorting domain-containing protein [Gammaproteobacteria bacterium]